MRVALLAALLAGLPQLTGAEGRVTLVRVQGNYRTPDEEVLRIAGIAVGDPFGPDRQREIEERLARSGRFERVEVRVRYRGLDESSDIALVLVVEEKSSVGSRIMFAPILDFTDEYGVTFGGRPALLDVGGEGTRISFPLSWGGLREAAIETELPFQSLELELELARTRRVNPHFDEADDRLVVGGRAGAGRGLLRFDVRGSFEDVDFDVLEDRFFSLGAGARLDSRIDPTIPGDAFYAGVDWRRLFFLEGASADDVNQVTVDLRGYKRLVGQSLLAVQAIYRVADGSMPSYEKPFLGGGQTLRGYEPGRFLGDSAVWGSIELRVPLTSPRSVARGGVHAFFDLGAVHDYGESIRSARFSQGAGIGTFFRFTFIGIRLDLGWGLDGGTRVHVASSMKF
jgi:outer membrane protein assembly factor BamA